MVTGYEAGMYRNIEVATQAIRAANENLYRINSALEAMTELLLAMVEGQTRIMDAVGQYLDARAEREQDESLRERGEMHTVTDFPPPA